MKTKLAVVVALVIVVSLSVAGCTTSSDSKSGTVSTDYPTSGRSKLIEGLVEYRRAQYDAPSSYSRPKAFEVTWISNTKAKTHEERTDASDYSMSVNEYIFTHFPSTREATAYLDSVQGQYYWKSGNRDQPINYYKVTGKDPAVYKMWQSDRPENRTISQLDALVIEHDLGPSTPSFLN